MLITNDTRRVPYNIPGSPYWQWVSIYTRLSQERIIFLNQPLTDGVANSVISALLYLESEDNKKPISLYINSIGDPLDLGMGDITAGMVSVIAGLAIYDTMKYIKSEVTTICLGQAVGMAALLLAAGTKGKRVSLPHAEIVLTSAKTGTQGQASDIQVNAEEVIDKRNAILEILAQETGQSVERIKKDTDRTFYLSPTQAQEYGIIDRVLETSKP
ncbi:ATP-dependent Clp protease proteolytic subunit [Aphanothece hegewaldii CCALA 016]|uniref:ATP-dependent Clp protease proteolytic subunit n=1 Tax=Aphanothece hegewaldii CCALA 016 TaxID=2107694 RepID=A0A2T1LZ87_9CHRO|nr:ATP-dependent Clp protease proteolytic subunit [Aphanothece hegewaldii]PSF37681.1 ATP-dependent Clp protease proteolytic subunit [Aphanothece hegewaldii CCALA 016]